MPLEIERKFLLKGVPKVKYDKKLEIIQFYCKKPDVRIRRVSEKGKEDIYIATVKTLIKPGVYEEEEKRIKRSQAIVLIKSSAVSFIKKTRFVKKFGKLKWEVDSFGGDMSLVVAEIELPKEGHKIKIPDYIKRNKIVEVTILKEFTNKNLAQSMKQLPPMIL